MPGYATISGPLVNASTEDDVRTGTEVGFNITLRNETWVEDIASPASRHLGELLLAGIVPSGRWGAEASGWATVVQPALLSMATLPLIRADDTTIIVALPPQPPYDIIAPEVLTFSVHHSLVIAEAAIVAEPTVEILVRPGFAHIKGTLICAGGYYATISAGDVEAPSPPPVEFVISMPFAPPPPSPPPTPPNATEPFVCNNTELAFASHGDHLMTIELINDSYIPILADVIGTPLGEIDQILDRLVASSWLHGLLNVSAQAETELLAQGWNLVVQPALRSIAPPPPPPNFFNPLEPVYPTEYVSVAPSGTELDIHWGVMPSYSIWVPETLSVILPAAVVVSDHDLVAAPTLIIWATPGTLRPVGALVEHNFETTIKQSASTLELTLDGDMWAPEVAHITCDSCPEEKSLPGSFGGSFRVMTPRKLPDGCPCLAGDPSATYVERNRNATFRLLDALVATGDRDEPGSWAYQMSPLLNDRSAYSPVLYRVNDYTLNLTLPHVLKYDIESPGMRLTFFEAFLRLLPLQSPFTPANNIPARVSPPHRSS